SEQIFALELTIDINNSSAGSRLIFDEAAGLQLICPTNVEKEPMQAKNLARSAPFRAKRHRHSRSRF
ncbi:MAG: hypothetical protein NTX25_16030, partial [Proteobacteria bacterium]|nr:hypothetical protein [Pseudomonadota bacterium]